MGTAAVPSKVMTVPAFFGCLLTAYGPALALFFVTVAKDPVRIIILILSAFFWLLSLLTSSIWWFAVVPLREELAFGLVFSIIFQETFRFFIYLLLRKADAWLKKLTESEQTVMFDNRHILAYVVGLGFGLMSGAFSMANVLADSLGPGTLGFGGEHPNFFMVSATYCSIMILLNTLWGVITFDAYDRRSWFGVVYVWATHLLVSCLSLLNRRGLYGATVAPAFIVLILTAVLAFRAAGGKVSGLIKCLSQPQRIFISPPANVEVPAGSH